MFNIQAANTTIYVDIQEASSFEFWKVMTAGVFSCWLHSCFKIFSIGQSIMNYGLWLRLKSTTSSLTLRKVLRAALARILKLPEVDIKRFAKTNAFVTATGVIK